MSNTFNSDGIVALWPTHLLQKTLPGAEVANQALAQLILDRDSQLADMTTDYRSGNLFEEQHPALGWLKECANRTVIDYLRNLGIDYEVKWGLQAWANVNRLGDYHDPHNHPHAYLSGTYYVSVPQDDEIAPEIKPGGRAGGRTDGRPGRITFYDPRATANMGAIRGDGDVEAEFTVHPKPGTIMLWPAYLTHFVHPNLSHHPRISISFNVVLRWSDQYLPHQ